MFNTHIALKASTVEEKLYALLAISRAIKYPISKLSTSTDGKETPLWNSIFENKSTSMWFPYIGVRKDGTIFTTSNVSSEHVYEYAKLSAFINDLIIPDEIKVATSGGGFAIVRKDRATAVGELTRGDLLAILKEMDELA